MEIKQYNYKETAWYNVLTYFMLFLFYQILISGAMGFVISLINNKVHVFDTAATMLLVSVVNFVVVMVHFTWKKWCSMDLSYIKSGPWLVLALTVMAALSSLLPSVWIAELLPEEVTENILGETFEQLLASPLGYIVVGLLAPVLEEVVFRGAILRRLLERKAGEAPLTSRQVRIAIVSSAALFSIIHMNPAQMPHAFVIGILLGWLYYRTGSILPGVLFHWVNNTMAFLTVALFPELPIDAKLIELFAGDTTALITAVSASALIFIPTLYALNKLMKRA